MESTPQTTPEKLIEESNNTKGVKHLFKLVPELASVGTEDAYVEYAGTIFPESTFKEVV